MLQEISDNYSVDDDSITSSLYMYIWDLIHASAFATLMSHNFVCD